MKKITLGLIALLVMCFLGGCTTEANYASEEVIKEIQQTLDHDELQVIIALGDNFEAKRGLIKSSELHGSGLVALCTNPMNLRNKTVQGWFVEAIERTELTAEQEVQIAKINYSIYSEALLLRTNLTADGLVAICENSTSLNLNNKNVQKWFKEAIERTELTEEQKVRIAESRTGGMGLF